MLACAWNKVCERPCMSVRPSFCCLLICCGLWLVSGVGCSSTRSLSGSPSCDRWVRGQGGLVQDAGLQAGVDALALRFADAYGEAPARVLIVDRDCLRAYAWRDRIVIVTRGLVEDVPESELAAAIAHELGHFDDEHNHGHHAALTHAPHSSLDIEALADRRACARLDSIGIKPDAMFDLLTRLSHDRTLSAFTRRDMVRRAELLQIDPTAMH